MEKLRSWIYNFMTFIKLCERDQRLSTRWFVASVAVMIFAIGVFVGKEIATGQSELRLVQSNSCTETSEDLNPARRQSDEKTIDPLLKPHLENTDFGLSDFSNLRDQVKKIVHVQNASEKFEKFAADKNISSKDWKSTSEINQKFKGISENTSAEFVEKTKNADNSQNATFSYVPKTVATQTQIPTFFRFPASDFRSDNHSQSKGGLASQAHRLEYFGVDTSELKLYTIQLASTQDLSDAQEYVKKLLNGKLHAFLVKAVVENSVYYRVCVGHFDHKSDAQNYVDEVLKRLGPSVHPLIKSRSLVKSNANSNSVAGTTNVEDR